MTDLYLYYRNTQGIRNDAHDAYLRNMEKARQQYEAGELDMFGYIAFAVIFTVYVLVVSLFTQLQFKFEGFGKPKFEYKPLTADEIHRNEIISKLDSYNTPVARSIKGEHAKNLKELSLTYLRKQIMSNGNIVKGSILCTTFPKVTGEDLLRYNNTGDMGKPFIIQRVTFGNDVNKALKVIFPELKNRKMKGQQDTYLVFEGNEVFTLEQKLRDLFMCPVTINLRAE